MQWKDRTILVTGGTGFIGSFLVEKLLDRGARVRVPIRSQNYRALSSRRGEIDWAEGDLRDAEYCRRLVEGVEEVFHLAACRRTVAYHQSHSGQVLHENIRMTLALLEALRDAPSLPVTFFSTANVPPQTDALSLSDQSTLDGYTLGKALCEVLWSVDSRARGFPLLILRPVGVYGPRDTFTKEGNVVPALFTRAQRSKDVFEVWGTGDEERAFLYVEDLVEALLRLRAVNAGGVQYVSSGSVVTVRELAENIRDLVSPGRPICFQPEKLLGPRTVPLLPPHPALHAMRWTPLAEGLRRTYESWARKEEFVTA